MVPAAFAGPDQAKPAAPSASPHVQSSRPRRCRGSSSLNCRLDFEHNPLPAAVCSKRATWSPVPAQREASAPSALSSVRACTDHSLRKRWRSSRPPEHQERDWWHSVCWIKTAVEIPQPSGLEPCDGEHQRRRCLQLSGEARGVEAHQAHRSDSHNISRSRPPTKRGHLPEQLSRTEK